MDSRQKSVNRAIKSHDSLLFTQESRAGRLDVYRKSSLGCNPPHFVFSLTEDWTPKGRPVEWGLEVIVNRIKAHDLWRDDNFAATIIRENEKAIESREKDRKNTVEAFLYDFRSQFARSTNDINTANLNTKPFRQEGH